MRWFVLIGRAMRGWGQRGGISCRYSRSLFQRLEGVLWYIVEVYDSMVG
jgi:hypothetical protein